MLLQTREWVGMDRRQIALGTGVSVAEQHDETADRSDLPYQEPQDRDVGDAGIGATSAFLMLVVLGVLVVGIFWALPAYFGSQVIEVTIRN